VNIIIRADKVIEKNIILLSSMRQVEQCACQLHVTDADEDMSESNMMTSVSKKSKRFLMRYIKILSHAHAFLDLLTSYDSKTCQIILRNRYSLTLLAYINKHVII